MEEKEAISLKIVRRLILVITLIFLLPSIISLVTSFTSGIPNEIKQQVKAGEAIQYELNKEVSLDQDKIYFKKLIVTEKESLLIYKVYKKEPGWSFPNVAIRLKDELGNVFQSDGGSSSSDFKGQTTINYYERIPKGTEKVIVDFEWYDRKFQTVLALQQEVR
jgi:hypothetical protein